MDFLFQLMRLELLLLEEKFQLLLLPFQLLLLSRHLVENHFLLLVQVSQSVLEREDEPRNERERESDVTCRYLEFCVT